MAQLLGQVNPGTIVKLNENGQPVNYIVVQQGKPSSLYDDSCNGTWLLRQDIRNTAVWNPSNNNAYPTSNVNTSSLPSFLSRYDSDIQTVIQTVKIPYCVGGGSSTVNSGANGLSTKLFLLSGYEVGWTTNTSSYFPVDGAVLSYFQGTSTTDSKRIAYSNGSPQYWWLRSTSNYSTYHVFAVDSNGGNYSTTPNNGFGIRPALILPSTMVVESDGTITIPLNLSIYVPSLAMQGQSLPIQWSPISNATSYQLQRNTGSTWETIYTGTDTSYTDTVGSWTTVQYQFAVDIGGGYGAYTQSASIPVIAASTLAISGQDGSLGTITADIPYTVTSDTGNPISIVRTVNGVRYASATVESGFAYNIPVMELPTGDGTIVITASVQSSSGLVTVTRTWTYTKTPINFSNSGSVASLSVNGENILPTTLAEAVRTSPVWGGSLDLALQKLSSAAFYETATPTAELGTLTPGLYDIQNNLLLSIPGVNIETGSYTGTGTYPAKLTFGFKPKVVFWGGKGDRYTGFGVSGQPKVKIADDSSSGSQSYLTDVTWEGNSVSWGAELNATRQSYYYAAIG